MKKCPTCNKRFEDSMRFCQADGTPLVDDAPPIDPYKTIVARPIDTSASEPAAPSASNVPSAIAPIAEPDEVLDLPDADPLKTMYVSEDEMRRAMGGGESGELRMEIPAEPETPSFIQNDVSSTATETPSPFSSPENSTREQEKTTPPIPSPFDAPPMFTDPKPPVPAEPPRPMFIEDPPYNDQATVIQDFPPASPFSTPGSTSGVSSEPRFEPAPPVEPQFNEPEPYRPAVMD